MGAGILRADDLSSTWRKQLDFTTKIFRARGLHLDDRHIRHADGSSFSASIVDTALYHWLILHAAREIDEGHPQPSSPDIHRMRSRTWAFWLTSV